jgi:glycosyltransferase involved in cell wall biosynthesis
MKLLYLSCDPGVPVLGHKGASVHLREMVAAFSAAGASVLVASPRIEPEGDELGARAELVEIEPVRPRRHATVEALREAMTAQARQVRAIARMHRVDAIYERLSLFTAAGVQTARRLGLPHVLEVNSPLCEEASRFRSLLHAEEAFRIEARVCAKTDHIFAVSEPLATRLAEEGVPRDKITVAPNGIDPRKFRGDRGARSSAFTIGFAGSLKPWHGIGVLLEAFARVLVRRPEVRLEIVGSGPEEAAIRDVTFAAGGLVHHGPLPHADVVALLTSWDVGVAPFLPMPGFYFSPLKVIEYMAAGACPVASDLGQIRTLLGGGSRGVLVEPANPRALADAILRLAGDAAWAAELGRRARAYALDSLGWGRNAERALAVLGALSAKPALLR